MAPGLSRRTHPCAGCPNPVGTQNECRLTSYTRRGFIVIMMRNPANPPPNPSLITMHNSHGKLAILACHFNPSGYTRPVANVHTFLSGLEAHGWHRDSFMAVCTFPGQDPPRLPVLDADHVFHFQSRSILWQKEALLNAAVHRLPPEYDKVAILDADVLLPPGWYGATVEALDKHPIIQPWSRVSNIHEDGTKAPGCRASVGRGVSIGETTRLMEWSSYHPGYAWAMRRDFWTTGPGLYQNGIVGLSDGLLALACACPAVFTHPQLEPVSHAMRDDVARWMGGVHQWQGTGALGCIRKDIQALTHGSRQNRRYFERLALLADFEPQEDLLARDTPGPLEWSPAARRGKEDMVREIAIYFDGRKEDEAATTGKP